MRQFGPVGAAVATLLLASACGAGSAGGVHAAGPQASATASRHAHVAAQHEGHPRAAAEPSGAAATARSSASDAAAAPAHDNGPAGRAASGGSSTQRTVPLVAAGDYAYRAHGHAQTALGDRDFDGRSRLTVTAPAADRRHITLRGDDGTSEQTMVGRADGLYLADIKMDQDGFSEEFRPSAPVLLLPADATVGQQWRWRMTSTDGDYTLRATLRLTDDSGSATISGRQVRTVTVKSVLVIEGDSLSMTMHQTDVAATDGLVVREDTTGDGTAYGTPVHTEAHRRLVSS